MRCCRKILCCILCMLLAVTLPGCSIEKKDNGKEENASSTGLPGASEGAVELSGNLPPYGKGKFIKRHLDTPSFPDEDISQTGEAAFTYVVVSNANKEEPERPMYLFERDFGPDSIYFYFYYLNEDWDWVRAGGESPLAGAVEGLNRDGARGGALSFLCKDEAGNLCFYRDEEKTTRIVTVTEDGEVSEVTVDKTEIKGIGTGESLSLYAVWEQSYYYRYQNKGSNEFSGTIAVDGEGRVIRRYGGQVPAAFLPGELVMVRLNGNRFYLDYLNTENGEKELSEEATELVSGIMGTTIVPDVDGVLYLYSMKGIYSKREGVSTWEQILDPSVTPLVTMGEFVPGNSMQFIVFTTGDEDFDCYVYSYDANAETETVLTVYSLPDEAAGHKGLEWWTSVPFIESTAGKYMERHPEVKIDIHFVDTEHQTVTDAVKTLNTQLLAGGGEDIIMLDGLRASGLIEKGALADISSLAEETELISDALLEPFRFDGKVYGLPVRFHAPVLMGTEKNLEGVRDLPTFVEKCRKLLKKFPETNPLYIMIGEPFAGAFYPVCAPAWIKGGSFNRELFTEFLEEMSELKELGKEKGAAEDSYWTMQKMPVNGLLPELFYYVCDIGGYEEFLSCYGILNYRNPKSKNTQESPCIALPGQTDGVLVPSQIFSINKNSANQEPAQDFIRFALSRGSRESPKEFGEEGMPVKKDLLLPCMKKLKDIAGFFPLFMGEGKYLFKEGLSSNEDGWISRKIVKEEITDQQAEYLCKWLEKVDTVYVRERELYDIIMPQILKYLDKKQSLETTADIVSRKVGLYLNE